MTSIIELEIPTESLSCADWISKQTPERVAEALTLCESACNALNSQISSGEVQRYAADVQALKTELAQQQEIFKSTLFDEREKNRIENDKQLQQEAEKHKQLLKSLEQKHETHINMTKQTSQEMQDMIQKELNVLRAKLEQSECAKHELISGMQKEIDLEVQTQLDRVKSMQQLQFESLQASDKNTIERLTHEIEQFKTQIALHKGDLADAQTNLRQQIDSERQATEQRIADLERQHHARVVELKEQASKWENSALQASKEKETVVMNFTEKVMALNTEQRDFLSNLSGNTSKGKLGETIAHQVFAELELGTLEDTGKNPNAGIADGYWRLDFAGDVPGIRALVEVKNCTKLHSQHDIGKFEKNVVEAVNQNRINCAMLISERCRIANTKQIDIRIEHGILVVRASRSANDDLSVSSLIKVAFTTIAQTWPHMSLHTQTNKDMIINNVSSFLSNLLLQMASLDQRIKFLNDTGLKMQRESVQLGETQKSIIQGVDVLHMQHGQLMNAMQTECSDIDMANVVLNAIEEYYQRHRNKRYPKAISDLSLDKETIVTQDMFNVALATAKSPAFRKKRKLREEVSDGQTE